MSEWKSCTLGDVLTLQRGFDLPTQNRIPGKHPVVASTGIVATHNEAKASGPGVVIGRSGSIGGGQFLSNDFWPLNTTLWVKDFHNNNERFCYYLLKSIDFSNFNVGGAVPTLNRNHVHPWPVNRPPRNEQDDIVRVLGSLDDKIELNRRTNETLEAMAQAIFKDWFVDFGPVRRKMQGETDPIAILGGLIENPVNAGPLAALFPDNLGVNNLPEGWGISTLEEYLEIRRGGSPRPIKDFISDVGFPWMKIADATSLTSPFVFQTRERIKVEGLSKTVKLQQGSLILSNSATPGLPKFLMLEACIHDGWLYFPKIEKLPLEFLYVFFLHIRKELVSRGNGSVFTNLKTDIVKAFEFPDAPIAIFDAYRKLVAPLFAKILLSDREIRTLAETRDYLLPKLMSGEIRAGDLELVG